MGPNRNEPVIMNIYTYLNVHIFAVGMVGWSFALLDCRSFIISSICMAVTLPFLQSENLFEYKTLKTYMQNVI